jgi:acyl-coenzyme A thioesterase PaaI-like protein
MHESEDRVTEPDVVSLLSALPFVRQYAISIVSVMPGEVTIDLPFDERFSGPPGQFPASMVGAAGDVAAVASCLSLLPKGWALATLDFTIIMTGVAKGDKLRARGRVCVGQGSTGPCKITESNFPCAIKRRGLLRVVRARGSSMKSCACQCGCARSSP